MKYDDLDLVVVWASIWELAESTAGKPGQTFTSEELNGFANKVLEAFPVEFNERMRVLERDVKEKYGEADGGSSEDF